MGRVKDETGNRYGRLVVLKRVENDKYGKAQWLCQCDCGNQCIVIGSLLRNGNTQSCGCIHTEQLRKRQVKDITGQTFGLLTAVELDHHEANRAYWRCKCKCGNEIITRSNSLLSGRTRSCGCIGSSYGEAEIEYILKANNIQYQREYTFKDLYSEFNRPLRFDFAIFNNNCLQYLIEYDGKQHTDKNCNWHTLSLEANDNLKNQYCKDNHILLYRINYDEDIEKRINEIFMEV